MKDTQLKDERIIRTADLLEQIKSVDDMIDLHSQKGNDNDLMLEQYKYKRDKLLRELRGLLVELNINPGDLAA